MMPRLTLVLDNLRSCHNVGSIIRTANAFGCRRFAFIGICPYPALTTDSRLPWQAAKQTRQIAKTGLGAELEVVGEHFADSQAFLAASRRPIICLEQTGHSQPLAGFSWPASELQLVVGNELDGVSAPLLEAAEACLHIPMLGSKRSLGVSIATAITLYQRNLQDG